MPVANSCGWDQKPHCGSTETRYNVSGPGPAAGPGQAGPGRSERAPPASRGGEALPRGPRRRRAGGPGQDPPGSGEGQSDGPAEAPRLRRGLTAAGPRGPAGVVGAAA